MQKAIEAGAEFIPATVFPEVTGRDAAWARMHDFEQNVLDNQASVADTALYVQGMNPKGRQLTEEETKQFTRQGSNSEAGSYIGLHGSTELINYLAAGLISPDYAHQIAQLAPGNADVQQVAIDALMQDKGITEAKQAAEIYRDNQALKESDIFQSLGNSQRQEAFMRFLSQYAANKIRTLGNAKRVHKGAKTDKSIREHEAAGVKFEDAAKNRAKLQELSAEQEAWKNVGTHPELIEEAKAEFDKTAEGAQQYLDFGNFSILVSKETLQKATSNELKSKEKIKLCTLPRVLSVLGEHAPGIYTRAETIYKLAHKHHLSNNEIEDIIKSLDDPLLVIKESSTSFIFYLPVKAKNKAGNIAPVMAALRMQRDEASGHYLMSAYPLDSTQKIEERIRRGDTVYSKYNKAALSNSNAPSPFKPDLVRLLVNRGFTDSVLTEEDIVNYNFALLGISDSFTAEEANFSIAALAPGDRFQGNPLAVRMSNYLRREAKRFARVLGDKTPHDTAVNAINSARSVIGMLDKYVHTNAIPIRRDARNRLNLLQRIIEKYAQIIEKGSKRSFNQISKEEQGVLDAIVEEMGAALETGQTKETAKARYKELIRMAAKGRVWQLLSEMMTEAGNLVDSYLKDELLKKLKRVTNTVKLKRSKSGKLKGKMGAADYRRMDTVVQLMGMSARAKDDALGQIEGARLLLNAHKNEIPEQSANKLIEEIRGELTAQGKEVTLENVYMALNNREADLLTFADIESMDYTQARKAANALATLISVGRAKWELIQQEKYEKIKAFLDHFYKHTSALHGTAQEAAQFFLL